MCIEKSVPSSLPMLPTPPPTPQIQGLLSCTMNQTMPRDFSSDAWSVGLPLLCMFHFGTASEDPSSKAAQLWETAYGLLSCTSKATDPLVGGPLFRCATGSSSAPCSLLTSAIPLLISFSPEHRKACREAGIRCRFSESLPTFRFRVSGPVCHRLQFPLPLWV